MNWFLVFLLLPVMLFPQDSLFQEIFTSFDKQDWDKVRKLIVKVDENKIPLKTKNDSIQFSIYNIVKFYTVFDSKKIDSNPNYESNYRFHLNYLSDNGLEDYMPAHYINYSRLNLQNEKVHPFIIDFLERAIEIENKGLNKSIWLSLVNLLDSYYYLDLTKSIYQEDYKYEYLIDFIETFEKRVSEIKNFQLIWDNVFLFKRYHEASTKDILDWNFRKHAIKKAFFYAKKIGNNNIPNLWSLRQILFSLRRALDSETINDISEYSKNTSSDKIKNWNTKKDILIFINDNYSDIISEFNFLINQSYIDFNSFVGFKKLDSLVRKKSTSEDFFSEDEKYDLSFLLQKKIYLLVKKMLLNNVKDKNNNYSLLKLDYDFTKMLRNKDSLDNYPFVRNIDYELVDRISSLLNFTTQYDTDSLSLDKESALVKERYNLTSKVINSNDRSIITPIEFINYLKYRSANKYQQITEEEVEADLENQFNLFTKGKSYKEIIYALELFNDFFKSAVRSKNMRNTNVDDALGAFYNTQLSNKITPDDINFRIKISKKMDLDSLKNAINGFLKSDLINESEYVKLNLDILNRKTSLGYSRETEFELYKYYMDNLDKIKTNQYINYILNSAVTFNFNYKLSFLINHLLKIANETKLGSDLFTYSFDTASGQFYKYVKRYDIAKIFFLKARENPNHWRIESVQDYTKGTDILYQLFDIAMTQKNTISIKEYLKKYKEEASLVIKEFLSLDSIAKNKGIAEDVYKSRETIHLLKSQLLDMERRAYYSDGKYDKMEKTIDRQIEMEEKKYFWGRFTLDMLKFSARLIQKKVNNDSLEQELTGIYKKNNKKFDKQYYQYLYDYLEKAPPVFINLKVAEFEKKLESLKTINNLSKNNQIYLMNDLGIDMTKLERLCFKPQIDDKLMKKLIEYRLIVDDLDKYNTRLLNLSEKDTDQYFEFLNTNVKNFQTAGEFLSRISEFDLFQQEKKILYDSENFIDLEGFKKRLNDNQAYLRYIKLYKDKTIAVLITNQNIHYIPITDKDLSKGIEYYTSRIVNKKEDLFSYNFIFKSIEEKLPPTVNEIFIKNDRELNNLNIESLYNSDKGLYVFDYLNINYVERPTSIFQSGRIEKIESAFLFGNPLFSISENEIQQKETSKVRSGISPLPFTEKEISNLNTILSKNGIKTVSTNLESSSEDMLYKHSKSNLIHIATHGFYIEEEKNNRFNWGLLATGSKDIISKDFQKTPMNDGIIFGAEIMNKNFTNTELVILSACETGFGKSTFLGSENLSNSFLRAGAKNIISTLWPVDDETTNIFMTNFYRELLRSKNIKESLRKTKAELKKDFPHPNYWAPFVLTINKI